MPDYGDIYELVDAELSRAVSKFGAFHNTHEGFAILFEEVDELWDAVKLNQRIVHRTDLIRREAIQVAAMAIRLIYDCCGFAPIGGGE